MFDKPGVGQMFPTDWKMMVNKGSFDYDRLTGTAHAGWDPEDDPWQNDFQHGLFKPMDELSGWVMPWQNSGEGMFGDMTVSTEGHATRVKAYLGLCEVERMHWHRAGRGRRAAMVPAEPAVALSLGCR